MWISSLFTGKYMVMVHEKNHSGRIKEKLEGKTGSRGFCGLSLLFLGCVCKLSAKEEGI